MMKRVALILAIATVFSSCGSGNESSSTSDSTVNSITEPPTKDSTSAIAPMMGDTSKIDADSLKE